MLLVIKEHLNPCFRALFSSFLRMDKEKRLVPSSFLLCLMRDSLISKPGPVVSVSPIKQKEKKNMES
jgi:hypothetical protein